MNIFKSRFTVYEYFCVHAQHITFMLLISGKTLNYGIAFKSTNNTMLV